MKKMKALWMILLAGCLAFALVGCSSYATPRGGDDADDNSSNSSDVNSGDNSSDASGGDNSSDETTAAELTLGSTFEFDDLEITIGNELTTTTLENQYAEQNGETVLIVPMTVKNISDGNKGLNMFYVKAFGSKGTELDGIDAYFMDDAHANILWLGEARPDSSISGNYYMLYDGNGDYYLNFDMFLDDPIEVKIPVSI